MHTQFRVLGPLDAVRGGAPVALGGRRERMLLAILLVHANEVLSNDRIFDELYGEQPPATAASSIQNAISRLRRVLGAELIETRAPGYALTVSPDDLDSLRFERLLTSAPVEVEARSETLHEALELWRGPPLADFAFEPFAQAEIARLEELRLAALEERIEADLALWHHGVLVGELAALIAEHPFRERLRRQLMLALYGAGRQAEALEAFQQARRTFVDELGIEPSPALRELERAMLQQDEALAAAAPAEPAAPVVVPEERPERRQTVTVLFADVVHSTRLARALDPEALREVMTRYFAVVRRVLERHGGTVEKFIGDAVMGVFGVPRVHEDDAWRAVRAGTAILDALDDLNRELTSGWGVEIAVRIGVNTGEVVAGGSDQLLATGEAVHLAKRLEEVAETDRVLIGEATWRLVRDAVGAEPVELGDRDGDLGPAWRVTGVQDGVPFARRLETPIVGRAPELERVRQAFDQAVADGRAQLFTVLGPAGIGKTRLALEFAAAVAGQATVLSGHCPSFGDALTYWPLRELVERSGEASAELAGLLERGRAEEILPATRALFERLAGEQPLVVVLEDLHWAEPTFLDLVEYLAEWVDGPVLLLCIARVELLEERKTWGGGLVTATSLLLEPLSAAESESMVGVLLGTSGLDERARARVVEAAEGNPLFVEQLLTAILLGEAEDLPPTIEALLAARLDRLGPGERAVIEAAAVAGREFTAGAVADLVPSGAAASVDRHVASLIRRELVRPLRSPLLGEDAFGFRHVLVRDAAYRSTPKTRRADLHERFGKRLDARTSGQDELVGFHFEQAYRLQTELHPADDRARRLAASAGDRLADAGIRAWKRGDVPAAVNLLGRATSLLPESERRRELLCELGLALRASGEADRALQTLGDAAETAAAVGDRRVELRARIEFGDLRLSVEPEFRASELLELVEQAIAVLEADADDRSLGRVWLIAGAIRGGFYCDHESGRVAAEQALAYYGRSGWPQESCVADLASALFQGPIPVEQAIARCRELLRDGGPGLAGVTAMASLGELEALRGRFGDARELVAQARQRYVDLGQRVRAELVDGAQARIELWAGDVEKAGDILLASCERLLGMRAYSAVATRAAELAEALYRQGRDEEAEEWTEVSRSHTGPDDISAQLSWRCVCAKVLARRGDVEAAELLGREAVALAERTDALNQRAQALLDLAEVLRAGGQFAKARQLVGEALELYERKGNLVGAEETRRRLGELAPA
jgi:class 3 adenylate cyclase